MPSHADLVERAARWLAKTRGCSVVLTEFASTLSETPDAIGWRVIERWSILVEAKTSRSDFLRDQKKLHRRYDIGVGQERWYLTPPGLLSHAEVPEGWGLIEAHPKSVRVVVRSSRAAARGATRGAPLDLVILAREAPLLLSALRRHYCRRCFAAMARDA